MKKRISILLVLSMILTVMVPMGVLAEESSVSSEAVFNKLVPKLKSLKPGGAKMTAKIAESLYNDKAEIEDNLRKGLKDDQKEYLKSKGIDSESIETLLDKVKTYMPKESDIKKNDSGQYSNFLVKLIFDENPTYSEYGEDIKKMAKDIYEAMPKELKDSVERYAETEDKKIQLFLQFVDAFINKEIGTGTYDVTNSKWTEIKLEVTDNHIKEVDTILSKYKISISETQKSILNTLVSELNTRFNKTELLQDAGEVLSRTKLITKVEVNKPSDPGTDEPSTPSTGGGGGGAPSSGGDSGGAAPVTTPGEIEEGTEVVKGELGKDEIKVTKKDGVTTVEVKEDKALATIEAIAKKADGKEAVLVVKAEKVDGINTVVSLPGSVILALKENKVNLEVVSDGIEYSIPFNAISTVNIDKKAKVEFKSEEVKEDVASELAKDIGEVNNTIELYIEITKGDKVIKVTNFNTPIEVRINVKGKGNYEKLAVYYLNEADNSLEFVSGHIVNDNIILKLNHLSKYVIVESTKTFTDIADHWAKDYVESMVAKNIINGYEDDTFKPEGKITRAEFVKMVVSAIDVELVDYKEGFNDVKTSDWHADYIATAKELDLIGGYTDGSFRPNATIKRAEMAVILGKVIDEKVEEKDIEALNTKFNDYEDIPEWALESVAKVVKAGLMNGTEKNEFCPNSDTTRAQGATTIYRLYN